jgi:hypothetical protein
MPKQQKSTALKISSIYRYPIKSFTGEEINDVLVESSGLQYDRHWMLVDEQGYFITQRKHPKMALIKAYIKNDCLVIKIPNHQEIVLDPQSQPIENNYSIDVRIWKDDVKGMLVGQKMDDLLSAFLELPCHLIQMNKMHPRAISDPAADGVVSFADGFPFLLLGTESLNYLNRKLTKKITVDHC